MNPPDSHHLKAASGWLELGNPREAAAELAKLSPEQHHHPEALGIRWQICAAERRWEEALHVAQSLTRAVPDKPAGWVDWAYALHELKRTREAFDVLLPMAPRFPKERIIPYNLACYACQLGDQAAARSWLARAVNVSTREEIQAMALADEDLRPLWPEIQAWGAGKRRR